MADLNSIIKELDASYNPARATINERINGLAGAEQSDIAGLQAQQQDAFGQITDGARQRGLGFSGIPIAEQARYTASSFLPAVAKVKQQTSANRGSLIDALNNLNLDQTKTAQSLYQTAQDREFQAREAELARQAQARATAAASRSIVPSIGGISPTAQAGGGAGVDQVQQAAYNDVKNAISSGDAARIQREYQAIAKSAGFGNVYDQQKLALFQQLYPAATKFGQNAQVGRVNVGVATPTQKLTVR